MWKLTRKLLLLLSVISAVHLLTGCAAPPPAPIRIGLISYDTQTFEGGATYNAYQMAM